MNLDFNRIEFEELEDRFEMATGGSCERKCAGGVGGDGGSGGGNGGSGGNGGGGGINGPDGDSEDTTPDDTEQQPTPEEIVPLPNEEKTTYAERSIVKLYSLLNHKLKKYPEQWEAWLYLHKFATKY